MPEHTATEQVRNLLREYGLDYSPATVNRWVGLLSDDRNNIVLIEQEIRESDEFKARFPGLPQRLDNGYNQISVEEYLALEDQYKTIIRNSGLPSHFYDEPEELAELIANDVSAEEFEERVVDGFIAAQEAPPEIKEALENFYGVGNSTGALAAFFLDPDRGEEVIKREFESAVIAGTADMTGFEGLSREQAEELRSLGVNPNAARAGFGEIVAEEQLTSSNLGMGEDFTDEDLIAAKFKGDADVQQRIRRQREGRLNVFRGGQQATLTQRGIAGLQET